MSTTTENDEAWDDEHELRERLKARLAPFCTGGEIRGWRGHYRQGRDFYRPGSWSSPERRLKDMVEEGLLFGDVGVLRRLEAVVNAMTFGRAGPDEPVAFPWSFRSYACPFCGQPLKLGFDAGGFVLLNDPCPHPDGLVTEWELNVPSGKLVVANDLRTWFPSDEEHDVNGLLGCHLTSLAYAKVGMAHGFVGNTMPIVYRAAPHRYVIGLFFSDDENEKCPWGDGVASVCTDLWWYSLVDLDELVRRVPHYTPDATVEEVLDRVEVVDVRPGVYRFRQEQGIDRDAPVVEFATFEWVRDPDPVRDYLTEEREKKLTAAEVLIENCLSWPTLFMEASSLDSRKGDRRYAVELWESKTPEEKAHALARAADQIMCTIGGGVEWHENGFPRTAVSDEARRLAADFGDVPAFDFKTRWYPISAGYGGLCLGAGVRSEYAPGEPLVHLAPDFVALGLNICQNAIRFGEEPRLNRDVYPPAYEIPFARDRMRLFVDCYLGLRKRYPDVVFDEQFDRWMRETDLDAYVASFDFGPERPPQGGGTPPPTVKRGAFFEFDASVLDDGYFCWAKGCWARKEDAERYAIGVLQGTRSPMGHLHVDASARPPSMIPLRAVGRVLRGTGEGHSSAHLVVTFDYGTKNMRGEMAFNEKDMPAVRQFDDEAEYRRLLKECKGGRAKRRQA